MKIYLAAPWVDQAVARDAKNYLTSRGLHVVSTWTEQADTTNDEEMQANALSDWRELNEADTIVLLALHKSEGKATEFGGALMAGKRAIVVSRTRDGNIFYHMPQVILQPSIEKAADYLCQQVLFD